MYRFLRDAAGAAAVLFVSLAAHPAAAGKADNTLNAAFDADFQSIDPYYGATREGNIIVHHIYDALLFRDPVTFEVKPSLATAYRWIDEYPRFYTAKWK
jgi:peptide/nickel transport system substrate-binding protein